MPVGNICSWGISGDLIRIMEQQGLIQFLVVSNLYDHTLLGSIDSVLFHVLNYQSAFNFWHVTNNHIMWLYNHHTQQQLYLTNSIRSLLCTCITLLN